MGQSIEMIHGRQISEGANDRIQRRRHSRPATEKNGERGCVNGPNE